MLFRTGIQLLNIKNPGLDSKVVTGNQQIRRNSSTSPYIAD